MKRQTVICREGWFYFLVLALVFGGAMLRDVNLLLVLAGLLAAPALFNWRLVRTTLGGLQVERKTPRGVCAGDLLVVNLNLRNARRRRGSWAVVVHEEIRREQDGKREKPICPQVLFPYIAAGGVCQGVYRGRLPRRGRYRLGPLRLSTRFPFGLFRRTVTAGDAETLTVLPRLGKLTRRWIARRRQALDGTQGLRRRHGTEGDFFGVRQWRPGDSRRWIHWRSSARHGQPVVRQFEQHDNRDVALLVDLWLPEQPSPEQQDNVELAVSFAATVLADECRGGGSNLLLAVSASQPECLKGPASPALLEQMMQRLAEAEADGKDHLTELLRSTAAHVEPGTEVVLVSTRPLRAADVARLATTPTDPHAGSPERRVGIPDHRVGIPARQIRCVDVSGEKLAEYFQTD